MAVSELVIGFAGYFFDENILGIMLWNSSIWLLLFLISISRLTYDKKKLKNLKDTGICIESEIKDIIPAVWIKIGNYNSCKIVCKFVYENKEYKAVSNYYVLTPFQRKEDFCVNVYIDKNNPEQYSVELFQTGG